MFGGWKFRRFIAKRISWLLILALRFEMTLKIAGSTIVTNFLFNCVRLLIIFCNAKKGEYMKNNVFELIMFYMGNLCIYSSS